MLDPQTRKAVQRLMNAILIGKHCMRGWMNYSGGYHVDHQRTSFGQEPVQAQTVPTSRLYTFKLTPNLNLRSLNWHLISHI